MTGLPEGTVTFLFSDIEGSTRLWEEHPDAMQRCLARHDELMRTAIAAHDGVAMSFDELAAVRNRTARAGRRLTRTACRGYRWRSPGPRDLRRSPFKVPAQLPRNCP